MFARRMASGCCVEPSAGVTECASQNTSLCLHESALSGIGSTQKCQVMEALVRSYKFNNNNNNNNNNDDDDDDDDDDNNNNNNFYLYSAHILSSWRFTIPNIFTILKSN